MADKKENKGTGILTDDMSIDDLPLDLKDTIIQNLPKLPPGPAVDSGMDDFMKSKLAAFKIKKES